jgi:prepilin-type N-terminal cleavage/methylation domain-containing protein
VRRRQQGFTLVEIIVALTVLALALLTVSRAFLVLLKVANQGGNLTVASSLAMRVIEQYRADVEGQTNTVEWVASFDAIPGSAGPHAFPAPYGRYTWSMVANQVDLSPESAYPCWLTSNPPGGCTPVGDHENTIKWITVRVFFDGGADPLAAVSSALIRDMYRRPP